MEYRTVLVFEMRSLLTTFSMTLKAYPITRYKGNPKLLLQNMRFAEEIGLDEYWKRRGARLLITSVRSIGDSAQFFTPAMPAMLKTGIERGIIGSEYICNLHSKTEETEDLETTKNAIQKDCADDDYTNAEKLEMLTSSLISSVGVRSCVRFYCVAEEVGAASLLEYYSGLLSIHWDDLTPQDFEHMSGPLLFKMLKSKTKYPLQAAVHLQKEDVVFLCLVESDAKRRKYRTGKCSRIRRKIAELTKAITKFADTYFNPHGKPTGDALIATLTRKDRELNDPVPQCEMVTFLKGDEIPPLDIHMYEPENVDLTYDIYGVSVQML
uniref:Uncharacterized protein n=1 Tax=Glossina palpalis gambiensis TaxID=67801 RepID=A0A1B0BF71_9MUSC